MDGINTFRNEIFEDLKNPDILLKFPFWDNCFYFGLDFVIVKVSEFDESFIDDIHSGWTVDFFKKIFTNGIKYISHTDSTITYGIMDEIYITYSHSSPGVCKETVTIISEKWRRVKFTFHSEKDIDSPPEVLLPIITTGLAHEIKQEDTKQIVTSEIIDKTLIMENGKKFVRLMRPDKRVVFSILTNEIELVIPVGVKLPFTFDPTISVDSSGGNSFLYTNHLLLFGEDLYMAYRDSAGHPHLAISSDYGETWPVDEEVITTAYTNVCIAIASDGTLYYGYGNSPTAYKSRTSGGVWSGETIIHASGSYPDVDVGVNGIPQFIYATGTNPWQHNHWDPVNGNTIFSVYNGARDYHGIYVDENNTAHLVWSEAGTYTNQRVGYRTLPYGGALSGWASLYAAGKNNRIAYNDIGIDSSGKIFISISIREPYPTWNTYVDVKNGAWGGMVNITNSVSTHHYGASLGIDQQDSTYYFWCATGYGTFPARNQIVMRKRDSAGVWTPPLASDPTLITDEDKDCVNPHSIHNAINGSIPVTGAAIAYVNQTDGDLIFWTTPDIVWVGGAVGKRFIPIY